MRDTIELNEREIVCIVCPNGCRIACRKDGADWSFSGQRCKRGADYAPAEMTRPMRSLTTSVRTAFADASVVSVRTNGEIEKSMIPQALEALKSVRVETRIRLGDVVVKNVCGSGVDVVCTTNRLAEPFSAR